MLVGWVRAVDPHLELDRALAARDLQVGLLDLLSTHEERLVNHRLHGAFEPPALLLGGVARS